MDARWGRCEGPQPWPVRNPAAHCPRYLTIIIHMHITDPQNLQYQHCLGGALVVTMMATHMAVPSSRPKYLAVYHGPDDPQHLHRLAENQHLQGPEESERRKESEGKARHTCQVLTSCTTPVHRPRAAAWATGTAAAALTSIGNWCCRCRIHKPTPLNCSTPSPAGCGERWCHTLLLPWPLHSASRDSRACTKGRGGVRVWGVGLGGSRRGQAHRRAPALATLPLTHRCPLTYTSPWGREALNGTGPCRPLHLPSPLPTCILPQVLEEDMCCH